MIHFPLLRTKRFVLQLKELSIGDSIALAGMPPHLEQTNCTAFLNAVIKTVAGVENPIAWTAQERMLAVCHYLMCIGDNPNFSVGENAAYFDYFDAEKDFDLANPVVSVGEIGGDDWKMRHLTGGMLETIERLHGEISGVKNRFHWLLGCMSAQLIRENEELIEQAENNDVFDSYLLKRMQIFKAFPNSDFLSLMIAFLEGRKKLEHFFNITETDFYILNDEKVLVYVGSGIAAKPQKKGADGKLPLARFRVAACLSPVAFDLAN
jgi:hypothetical protein